MKRYFLIGILTIAYLPAQTLSANAKPAATTAAEERDGQHDFDFEFGKWKAHNRRLLHPLTGANDWVEFDGTIVARPVWGGKANIDEFQADSPTGHIEGMTVRTYNNKSHQWSIYWANQRLGVFSLPAMAGKFDANGRGEFYDQEDFNGTSIYVRYLWIVKDHDTTRWEQAFSNDGGKTWETNWIMDAKRIKE